MDALNGGIDHSHVHVNQLQDIQSIVSVAAGLVELDARSRLVCRGGRTSRRVEELGASGSKVVARVGTRKK